MRSNVIGKSVKGDQQVTDNRDGVSTNPLKRAKKHTQYEKSAKTLVFSLTPTTAIPTPGLGAGRIPITVPRGTTPRGRALKGALGFSRTGTGSARMNRGRGFGTFF